jgi:hypothetical protein
MCKLSHFLKCVKTDVPLGICCGYVVTSYIERSYNTKAVVTLLATIPYEDFKHTPKYHRNYKITKEK